MALIKCTECGKEFSDRAAKCPNCACPTEFILEDIKVLAKKEHIQNEEQIAVEQFWREEAERDKEEKEAKLKRQAEEKERKEKEEMQLKKVYEEKESYNQEVVMHFPLFGVELAITRGMRNKIHFYRESKNNKKTYIKEFEKAIQKIQNLNDMIGTGMHKFNACIEGYVDKQCNMLKSFEDVDLELLTSILTNESEAIVEDKVGIELGEFMDDFRRMQGPSPEDTEQWTREKYRVFNKYPIRDMLLKCLKDIIDEIQGLLLDELAKQGVFIEWQPKQLEYVRLEYKEFLQRYKNQNCSLSELRYKIIEVLSVDTYNQQHYQDILNYYLIGGEKENFVNICDFLGFNEIYRNYKFFEEETYIKELEIARDYLYGRGVSKDIDKAKELLEENSERFKSDKNYLEELSIVYEKSGDKNYKSVLLERCKLGDLQAAQKIISEVMEKEEVFEQVNLYSQIKSCFKNNDFSYAYNKIFNRVKKEVEDVTKKIEFFIALGEPTNSNDLYYVAKLFEKSELEELWVIAAQYYLLAANSNHTNSMFKTFAIVENGLLDVSHSKASIVMKKILYNDYKTIIGFIKQLSTKGNLYAKYLYATYLCANYTLKNYKMPYIFVDKPETDVEMFFSEYYFILSQAEDWLKKGADKATESILHTTKADILVTVAKYFRKGPSGTVMSESARRRLEQKYSTIREREYMALKVQDICKCEGKVSPIIGDFMDGFDKKYSYERNYCCDLFEIYCGTISGIMKYYAVSPFGDIMFDTVVPSFLNGINNEWDAITYGKKPSIDSLSSMDREQFRKYLDKIDESLDESITDDKYKNKATRVLYNKYRCQCNLNGCNFSYYIYGKQTMGAIVRKNKIIIEMQNGKALDEAITLTYVGNCVFGKKKDRSYFFVDKNFKEYNSLNEMLKQKCCDSLDENTKQTKIICPYCDTVLDLDMDFCFNCGKHQDIKNEVFFVDAENFELLRQTLVNKEYDRLKKMVGDNANICVQYEDGRRDWLLNKTIELLKDEKIVEYLLKKGADCNSVRDKKWKNGALCKYSPLADAIEYAKSLPIIKTLVENGANLYYHRVIDDAELEDAPLLNLAIIKTKNYDIVKYLWDLYGDEKVKTIRRICHKNHKDKSNTYSLLFDAIEFSKSKEIVKLLLDNGYNPNEIRHDEYNTPNKEVPALNAAILWGNSSIVEMLLKYGANPHCYRILHEVGGDQRYSALADAMITNNDRNIAMLLNAGASLDEWVFYKDRMIKLQKYPLKKSELSARTIENLKRHGWQPPLFSFLL